MGGDAPEQAGGDERVGEVACRALTGKIVAQKGAGFIAGELAPRASGSGHGGGAAIRIWVISDKNIGADLLSVADAQVEGTGLFRVGEGDGGEIGIRLGLLRNQGDAETAAGQELFAQGGADAVHGGQRDGDIGMCAHELRGAVEVLGAGIDIRDVLGG